MSRTILVVMVIALLVILGGALSIVSLLQHKTPLQADVQTDTTTVHRIGSEVPESDHGVQATKPNQSPTKQNPWGIAVDNPHGFIWVAEPGCDLNPSCPTATPTFIGKYSQADGSILAEYNQPAGYSSPAFLAVDEAGHVWFTQPTTDAIGEFDPITANWSQWKLPKGTGPFDLIFDHNGNLWFTGYGNNTIGFLHPPTHQISLNIIPTPMSNPYGITMDAKGTIWFAENALGTSNIASFTPTTSGRISIYEHRVLGATGILVRPHLIVADKVGRLWYTQGFAGTIGEYNPATKSSTDYNINTPCPPGKQFACSHTSGIAVDQKGNIWFTDSLGSRVGFLIPGSGRIVVKVLPNLELHPHDGLAIDAYNTIWFAEQNGFQLDMWPSDKLN